MTETIKIFARIRPIKSNSKIKDENIAKYQIQGDEYDKEKGNQSQRITLFPARSDDLTPVTGHINNSKERFDFAFNRIFDPSATQDLVFDEMAKEVVEGALNGYNGTIFAYGQTGSGKTFTITGGTEKYSDRGIIPRSIQYLYREAAKRKNWSYAIQISYLEIYNESGYDLLDTTRDAKKLEDLPRVSLMEDDDSTIHIRNLSVVNASNEEEALNLLFIGDTNRTIAETPSNPASSRSHCIFIISITSRDSMSEGGLIRRSKLHLVDLAGSERVSKTQIDGALLNEAKHINLSLHFLEQVIVSLHEKSTGKRSHVPYRNSMMTSVLRDSIGGNCKTVMIATIAIEEDLILESISTCRFAQRVALIKNDAKLNEEMDPYLLIEKLKSQIAALKAEIALLRGGNSETNSSDDPLSSEELQRCHMAVESYLSSDIDSHVLSFSDYRKTQACFKFLKDRVLQSMAKGSVASVPYDGSQVKSESIEKLENQIQHRDNEIRILVSLLRKQDNSSRDSGLNVSESQSFESDRQSSLIETSIVSDADAATIVKLNSIPNIEHGIIMDKYKAFDMFKTNYPKSQAIDENKQLLKQKIAFAKVLGEQAGEYRSEINSIKGSLEKSRAIRLSQALTQGSKIEDTSDTSEEEGILLQRLEQAKSNYKSSFVQLKDLKLEIEHLQHLLDNARLKLQKDFEVWYSEYTHEQRLHGKSQRPKSAWDDGIRN